MALSTPSSRLEARYSLPLDGDCIAEATSRRRSVFDHAPVADPGQRPALVGAVALGAHQEGRDPLEEALAQRLPVDVLPAEEADHQQPPTTEPQHDRAGAPIADPRDR